MKLVWKQVNSTYSSHLVGYAGKWPVGTVQWRSGSKGDDGKRYGLNCRLPGIKADLGVFMTEEEAQDKLQKVMNHWLSKLTEEKVDA